MAHRNYCFTLNNPLQNRGLEVCDWLEANSTYAIVGCEVGENGTFHWQGYFEFAAPKRMRTMLALKFPWHLEPRRGNQKQAIEYCKKDGNVMTHGKCKKQGSRDDLCDIRQLARDEGMRAVTRVGNLQQIRVAEKYLSYNEEARDWKPEVIYITGPSGAGKSRMAREIVAARGYKDDCYVKNTGTKWWDGYDRHAAIILDDFRDSWWDFTYFIGLIDRYSFVVEVKGGTRQLLPRLVIITCIRPVETLYSRADECGRQIARRIDTVRILESVTDDATEVGGGNTIPPDMEEVNVMAS